MPFRFLCLVFAYQRCKLSQGDLRTARAGVVQYKRLVFYFLEINLSSSLSVCYAEAFLGDPAVNAVHRRSPETEPFRRPGGGLLGGGGGLGGSCHPGYCGGMDFAPYGWGGACLTSVLRTCNILSRKKRRCTDGKVFPICSSSKRWPWQIGRQCRVILYAHRQVRKT